MRRRFLLAALLLLSVAACRSTVPVAESAAAPTAITQDTAKDDHPVVVIETDKGKITVELDRTKAPKTVDNFLKYVDKKFYDGLVFHRVISGFMVQGGGFEDVDGRIKEKSEGVMAPVKNESKTGLSNKRGTIAMARTNNPDSATCQFFINQVDNLNLDNYGGGYTAFGKVTEGMEIVDAIAQVDTTTKRDDNGSPNKDVPVKPILIKSIRKK